jgi:hypothetical protein
MIVDLPTPDVPTKPTVRPGLIQSESASRPAPGFQIRRGIGAGVGLIEEEDRRGAALPADRQEALEPARVEVGVERGGHEHRVQVRADDLLLERLSGGPARQLGAPRQDFLDERRALSGHRLERDPVSDRGQLRAHARAAAHRAGQARDALAVGRDGLVGAAPLGDDARRNQPAAGQSGEVRRPARVPAPILERRHPPILAEAPPPRAQPFSGSRANS